MFEPSRSTSVVMPRLFVLAWETVTATRASPDLVGKAAGGRRLIAVVYADLPFAPVTYATPNSLILLPPRPGAKILAL